MVRLDHAPAILAFERENRAYFAASIPDRGDEYFAGFDARHAQLLEFQAAGTDYLHVLVADDGEVVGRVNLIEVADGSAELGYRIAQKAAGRGLATAAVREVRELAATEYGLARLRARVTLDNPASRKVLERNGFVAVGELTLDGKPAMSYRCELAAGSDRARSHVEHFNLAVRGGAWEPFVQRFTDDARMVFTNVPAGPFEGRAEILRGYQEQPPNDTMTVESVSPVDPDTDRVRFRWDAGGPGTMLLRWRGDKVVWLEITFG